MSQFIDKYIRDGRRIARGFVREPLFVVGVVLSMAIGLGASTLMIALVHALLLRPPPYLAEPDRLVRLFFAKNDPILGGSASAASNYPTLSVLRSVPQFVDVAGYAVGRTLVGRGDNAVRGTLAVVSARYFTVLGARPALGRFFAANDDARMSLEAVAVISDALWHRVFAADSNVIGRSITLDNRTYAVVGVAPPFFTGPELRAIDAWVPLSNESRPSAPQLNWRDDRGSLWLSIIARLQPGASASLASDMATLVLRRSATSVSPADTFTSVLAASTIPGRGPDRPREVRVAVWLAGVSVMVLLLVCANVTALLLARAARRRRDVAIQMAVGARRADLARSVVLESILLSSLSALVAIVGVRAVATLVQQLLLPSLVWPSRLIGMRAAVLVGGVAFVLVLAMNMLALWYNLGANITDALSDGRRAGWSGSSRMSHSLIAVQATVCTLLVFGAMLFAQSLYRVQALDLGVDLDHTLSVSFYTGSRTLPGPDQTQLFAGALRSLATMPEVDHSSLAEAKPYAFGRAMGVYTSDTRPEVLWNNREVPYVVSVGSGFFAAVGATSLRGRDFGIGDRLGTPAVTIINGPLARLFWPHDNPIGKCLRLDDGTCATVVGVLDGVWKFSVLQRNQMALYLPLAQDTARTPSVMFVHVAGEVNRVRQRLRKQVHSVRPDLPPPEVSLLRDAADPEYGPWRLAATMFTAFGVIALSIATIGMFSLVSFTTSKRRHEIGVRVALGAGRPHIVTTIAGGNLVAASSGLLTGAAIALVASRWTIGLMYQTSARDPILLTATMLVLLLTAAAASFYPVARMMRNTPAAMLQWQ